MYFLERQLADHINLNLSLAETKANAKDYLEAAQCYMEAASTFERAHQTYYAAQTYQKAGNYFGRVEDNFRTATAYSRAADSYGRLGDTVNARELYVLAANLYQENNSNSEAAECFQFAAQASLEEEQMGLAGEFYASAAKLLQDYRPNAAELIFRNYLNSCLAYIEDGNDQKARKSYTQFKFAIEKKGYVPKDNFYFDKLVKTLSDNGLDEFASKVYVEKMNMKVGSERPGLPKLIYWIWGKTSDYGENWSKWMAYTIGTILFFSLLYFPNPWGYGLLELSMTRPFRSPVLENFAENMIQALSFSVTVFSTLGFGDVLPANWIAELVVICEVLIGYAFLAIFITLVSRKLMRR
jgi:tetratricopeptide (TPR) repeat protein